MTGTKKEDTEQRLPPNVQRLPPSVSRVPGFGMRHIQMILIFIMLTIAIGMRIQLSVAIVAMTDNTTSPNPDIPTFKWNNKSIVLSSFYWGYLTLQLIAGSLARIYGAKKFLVGAMTINSIACMLIPTAAIKLGSYGVIGCRVLQGISQGFFYPSVYNLLGRWAPVTERSRLGSLALAGFTFGATIGQPIAGYMSSSWIGWPSSFYLYGCFGLTWTVLWIIFGASSPAEHRSIMTSEKDYIESSLGIEEDEETSNIPWKSLLTSLPIWTLATYFMGCTFGNVSLQVETPIYMSKVLGFDIKTNSLLSAASSVAGFLASFLFGNLADFFINNRYMSRQLTRKVFASITCLLSAIGLVILSFLPSEEKVWSVFMFILIGFAYGAGAGGPNVNQIDLSPRYAGIIMAITNTCSAVFSFIGPMVLQLIVTDDTDRSQWKIFFYSAAALFLMSNVVFASFGSADRQPWDSYGLDKSKAHLDLKKRKISKKLSVVMSHL